MYLSPTTSTPSRVHCRILTWQLHPSGTSNRQHTPPPQRPSTSHPYHTHTIPQHWLVVFPHPNSTFPSTTTLIPLPDNMKPAILKPTTLTSAWCPSRGFALFSAIASPLNALVTTCCRDIKGKRRSSVSKQMKWEMWRGFLCDKTGFDECSNPRICRLQPTVYHRNLD